MNVTECLDRARKFADLAYQKTGDERGHYLTLANAWRELAEAIAKETVTTDRPTRITFPGDTKFK